VTLDDEAISGSPFPMKALPSRPILKVYGQLASISIESFASL